MPLPCLSAYVFNFIHWKCILKNRSSWRSSLNNHERTSRIDWIYRLRQFRDGKYQFNAVAFYIYILNKLWKKKCFSIWILRWIRMDYWCEKKSNHVDHRKYIYKIFGRTKWGRRKKQNEHTKNAMNKRNMQRIAHRDFFSLSDIITIIIIINNNQTLTVDCAHCLFQCTFSYYIIRTILFCPLQTYNLFT